MGRTSVQGGSNPLISKTMGNTEDEISEARRYEARQDQEAWAGSHDLPRSTGIQVSRSRVPVTSWYHSGGNFTTDKSAPICGTDHSFVHSADRSASSYNFFLRLNPW